MITKEYCQQLDAQDELANLRNDFSLPAGIVYLNGNSLGALPIAANDRAQEVIVNQWGKSLIKSWNTHDWYTLSQRIGDQIATTIGADKGEVVAVDATGINIFKVIAAALKLNPCRQKILMEGSNFPTDNYMVQGLLELLGEQHEVVFAETQQGILDSIDASVAVVFLTQVHYKTGTLLNMAEITSKTKECAALSVWDLSHSAGALPVDLNGCGVDFAVGCTYKFYNGGPGSPAFVFCPKRHQGKALQPLTGWHGHTDTFAFERDYRPAKNINQMLTGTQCIISLSVSEVGIKIVAQTEISKLREKSLKLSAILMQLVEQELSGFGFDIVTPMENDRRGSQVALAHKSAYPIMQALIEQGVIGDFRTPDILRFGLAPLYNSYSDVWRAVQQLKVIMEDKTWKREEFISRKTVT